MNLIRPVAAAAMIALVAVPTVASPTNPAARLSLAFDEADSGGEGTSEGSGGGSTALLLGVGGAAVVGAALLLGSNDSDPASS